MDLSKFISRSQFVTPPAMYTPSAMPDSCCTTEDEEGNVVTLDWLCILGSTFKQVYFPSSGTCSLYLYNFGVEIELTREQTTHLLRYIKALDNPAINARIPRGLLDHPSVKKQLEGVK